MATQALIAYTPHAKYGDVDSISRCEKKGPAKWEKSVG